MKLFKKIFTSFLVVAMLVTFCTGLTACKDIRTLELQLKVYDYSAEEMKDATLTIELYRHLAEQTVDSVIEAVEDGFYDGAVFYKMDGQSNQIMLGDYKVDENNKIVRNDVRPTIKGEFDKNGVVGSDLTNKKGAVGLWRSWYAADTSYNFSSDARDSGSATWYLPTKEIAGYDGWMCVFGQIDLEDAGNKSAFELIEKAFSNEFDQYAAYFTGEYDQTKSDEDYGLEFNLDTYADYNEKSENDQIEDIFVAEGKQLVKYNAQTFKVAEVEDTGVVAAKVVKAIIK